LFGLFTALVVGAVPAAAGEPCAPEWAPTFGPASGLDSGFTVGTVFDDGAGPALYVAGGPTVAGGFVVNNIARWDGEAWSPLGAGLGGPPGIQVNALAVFDDGSGPALYAAGLFDQAGGTPVNNIAKWDGESWSALGDGLTGSFRTAKALCVYDDGSGPALYAGGEFTLAGGAPANGIAKWDGAQWSAVGGGVDTFLAGVEALAVFDDGGGPSLIIGGGFSSVGGVSAQGVAAWDGQSWAPLGGGIPLAAVYSLYSFDDGVQETLFAGGQFSTAGGVSVTNIAQWNGAEWSAVGAGINANVRQLIEYDGAAFAVTGLLDVLRWDGKTWASPFPDSRTPRGRLAVFDEGDGPSLFVGNPAGILTDTIVARGIARWDGEAWAPVGDGLARGVSALAFFDEGAGPRLFAVGGRPFVDGRTIEFARWDGVAWSDVGSGVTGIINALMPWNDGAGEALYVGGSALSAGGLDTFGLIRWDGATWSAVGGGVSGPQGLTRVEAFASFDDDGDGVPSLFVGGSFTEAGGVASSSIAKWDGAAWSALGQGIGMFNSPVGPQLGFVRVMETYDDGAGAALYVGGAFNSAGDVEVFGLAKWDGTAWSPVGDMEFSPFALEVFDDGSGPALYASRLSEVLRWDGATWSSVGTVSLGGSVYAMGVFDDGAGPALYIGGVFDSVDGVPVYNIAKWDGQAWSAIDVDAKDALGGVGSFASHPNADGALTGLFVGGGFERLIPSGDDFLARYVGCAAICPGDTNGDGIVNFTDLNAVLGVFGQSGADLPADLNGDGVVDFTDLNEVLSNFGISCR
jgi:hypothetical protein